VTSGFRTNPTPPRRVEVGGDVRTAVERAGDHLVVHLDGPLSRSTAPQIGNVLLDLIAEEHVVLVELARLRLGWAPGVEVFPMTLRIGGGWPLARLVLYAADADLAAALHAAGVPERVPLVPDRRTATARRNERPGTVERHFNLVGRPTSGRAARRAADNACRDWHVPHLASDLALIADELVTNVVEHTDSTVGLTIGLRGSELTVSVRDDLACAAPRPQLTRVGRPCGRGLHVVASLASAWGVIPHADGKTVWASVVIDGSGRRPSEGEEPA
jgi:hypothetical protein